MASPATGEAHKVQDTMTSMAQNTHILPTPLQLSMHVSTQGTPWTEAKSASTCTTHHHAVKDTADCSARMFVIGTPVTLALAISMMLTAEKAQQLHRSTRGIIHVSKEHT